MNRSLVTLAPAAFALALPLLMGANGQGCGGPAFSQSDAPDVTGAWNITYDDKLAIEVNLGGTVYKDVLGPTGGKFTVMHQGKPVEFNLDCARPEVVCPSEAWPRTVQIAQKNTQYEHQMVVTLPLQSCTGKLVAPAKGACGEGTNNPSCDKVCDGTVSTASTDRFGVIDEDGGGFGFVLGAGAASNGVNCLLLGLSTVRADLVNTGSSATKDWKATAMSGGEVVTGYAGGCLWAGDPNMDKQLEAVVIGASVKFTTGFTGVRAR